MPNYFQQQSPWTVNPDVGGGAEQWVNLMLRKRLMQQQQQQMKFENQQRLAEFGLQQQQVGQGAERLGLEREKFAAEKPLLGLERQQGEQKLSQAKESQSRANLIGQLSQFNKILKVPGSQVGGLSLDPAKAAIQNSGPLMLAAGLAGAEPMYVTREQLAQMVQGALAGQEEGQASQTPGGAEGMALKPELATQHMQYLEEALKQKGEMANQLLSFRQGEAERREGDFQQGNETRRTIAEASDKTRAATGGNILTQDDLMKALGTLFGDGSPVVSDHKTMGKPLDRETAAKFLQQAGGDKAKARALAQQAGYTF